MVEPLTDSLRKIARGTGIALVGTFVAMLLGFIIRIIIARYSTETDYGVYSMAIVIMTFAITLVSLGLPDGTSRYIAYFRGRRETGKVKGVISVSFQLTAIASIIVGLALFFSAEYLATNIFHTPDLAHAIKVFAVGVPFLALINILVSIFRGYDRMEPQAYFQYILFNALFLLFVSILTINHLSFTNLFYAYVAALILTFIALLAYSVRKLPQPINLAHWQSNAAVRKELLIFSLPLLATAILATITLWMDTLLLGYYKTPDVVGLYNAASPLARFVSDPLGLMMLIYTPVATGLYSNKLVAELRRNYVISTKWLVSLTLPFFLVLFWFPDAVLNLFFGPTYMAAAPALRILSFGFIISNFFGTNQSLLLAMGRSKFLMWTALSTAIASIFLNIVLIPPFGIVGAAIATAISVLIGRIMVAIKVFHLCRAQPLSKNLLKPVLTAAILTFFFWFTTRSITTINWWILAGLFVLYYTIYGISVLFTRSFDSEDIALLLTVEKMMGINVAPVKRILGRFINLQK